MKRNQLYFIMLLITLLIIFFTGCNGKREEARDKDTIRVAFFPNITHTQALVMKDKGFLENELGNQYKVEWLDFNAGPSEVEAMFAGEVDIGYIGPVPAITAYNQADGEIQIIAGASEGGAVLITRAGLNIQTVEELSGKTVAVPKLGNTQHLLLLKILSDHGLKPKANGGTVNVVPVANADEANVMEMGQVDAALVPEPWGSTLEQQIGAEVLLDYKEVWKNGNYSTAVVMAGKDFLDSNEQLVQAFINVHKKTTQYIKDNQEEAKESVDRQIEVLTGKNLEKDILERSMKRIIVSEKIPVESVSEYAEVNKEQGFIKNMPGVDIIENKFLTAAE